MLKDLSGISSDEDMYYFRDAITAGLDGLELIDSEQKVKAMVMQYENLRVVDIRIMKSEFRGKKRKSAYMNDVLPSQQSVNQQSKGITRAVDPANIGNSGAHEEGFLEEENLSDGGYDEEEPENLRELKRQREEHLEGDTYVEELFPMIDDFSVIGSIEPPAMNSHAHDRKTYPHEGS